MDRNSMLREMPEFLCHKVVRAAVIEEISTGEFGEGECLTLVPQGGASFDWSAPADWVAKHKPRPGGYVVLYDNGYVSYSPRRAFEDGYTLLRASTGAAAPRRTPKVGDVVQYMPTGEQVRDYNKTILVTGIGEMHDYDCMLPLVVTKVLVSPKDQPAMVSGHLLLDSPTVRWLRAVLEGPCPGRWMWPE